MILFQQSGHHILWLVFILGLHTPRSSTCTSGSQPNMVQSQLRRVELSIEKHLPIRKSDHGEDKMKENWPLEQIERLDRNLLVE
jgi:hypothetical protein